MTDYLGDRKLAVSAQKLLASGERVQGAVPATIVSVTARIVEQIPIVSLLFVPVHVLRVFKTPLRAIVWTDQRLVVMTRGVAGFAGAKAGRVLSDHPVDQRLDGEMAGGSYTVKGIGARHLHVQERYLSDLLRLERQGFIAGRSAAS